MGVIRAIIRLFGLLWLVLAAFLALFALYGFMVSDDTSGRVVAGVLGGVALLSLAIGLRILRYSDHRRLALSPAPNTPSSRAHTGLRYEDFTWHDPPPSRKQFGYAMSLGAEVCDGMTKWIVSDLIDEAIEQQRGSEPATKDQLRTIQKYHGVLPRTVTRGEARQIIEFLEDYTLRCPFCDIEIWATDNSCCACSRSLRPMKIPIKL